MSSISRSISPACGTIDSKQPMAHIRLYREGADTWNRPEKKKKKRRKRKGENAIADEQPSTLGVPNFKKSLQLQESIKVIIKHSTEGIHQWPLWLQDGCGRLLRLLLCHPCLHLILSADSRYSTLQALSSAGWSGPLLPTLSWL
jgi:hypothetical protein